MFIIVFITCANKKQADKIASGLIKEKLAACVNTVPKIKSLFWWENKVDSCEESLLIVKSKKEKLPGIIKSVRSKHSYKVPEIIALPVLSGYKPYLEWIDDSLRKRI